MVTQYQLQKRRLLQVGISLFVLLTCIRVWVGPVAISCPFGVLVLNRPPTMRVRITTQSPIAIGRDNERIAVAGISRR